jgi:hypothetical protein
LHGRGQVDWSPTTLRNCQDYLTNPSCRFTLWRDEVGIRDLEDLTVERLEGFLARRGNSSHLGLPLVFVLL